MKNSTALFSNKLFILIIAVVLLLVLGPAVSYIYAAYSWTNPSCQPPNCNGAVWRDQANGYVVISPSSVANPTSTLTVNGTISAMGNWLQDIRTPSSATDGVNKGYVDAAVAAAGGGATLTLYGVSSSVTPGGRSRVPTGTGQANCFVGATGLTCGQITTISCPGPNCVLPGQGTSACSSLSGGWQEAFAGYGPYGTMLGWYGNAVGSGGDTEEVDRPAAVTIGTYSVCGEKPYHWLSSRYSTQTGAGMVWSTYGVLSACADGGNGAVCNTCRVCYK